MNLLMIEFKEMVMEDKKKLLFCRNVIGFCEENDQVFVFVTKKLKLSTLRAYVSKKDSGWKESDIVPEVVDGKPSRVIEIGKVQVQDIMGGLTVQSQGINSLGTLGLPYSKEYFLGLELTGPFKSFKRILSFFGLKVEKKYFLLTNSHVLNVDVTNPVLDRNVVTPYHNVSTLVLGRQVLASGIDKNGVNEFDVGIVEVNKNIYDFVLEDHIKQIGQIKGVRDVLVDGGVKKYGHTTKYTEGVCVLRDVTISVDFGLIVGSVVFSGLDMFSPMSDRGDSGSVIVDSGNFGVSLLFAGSPKFTFGIPLSKVFDRYIR
jgi:hypothetical protein